MNFEELLKGRDCACGMKHTCSIKHIIIGKGANEQLGGLLGDYKKILLVADTNTYAACGVELVLAGHAHGGQVRLPFIGGLIAPGQGLFPEYDAGCYAIEDMKMIVSRGIGNSVIPLRINNRPEIVVIDLQHE